jgi:hypothetical protein
MPVSVTAGRRDVCSIAENSYVYECSEKVLPDTLYRKAERFEIAIIKSAKIPALRVCWAECSIRLPGAVAFFIGPLLFW